MQLKPMSMDGGRLRVKSRLDGPHVGLPLYPLKADSERTSNHIGFGPKTPRCVACRPRALRQNARCNAGKRPARAASMA